MTRDNKLGILANLILVMFMSSSICQTLYTSFFVTGRPSLVVFLLVIPLTFLFYFMFRNKLSTIISLIAIFVAAIAGLSLILFKIGAEVLEFWFFRYFTWFIDMTNGYLDATTPSFTYFTIILLALVITFFVYLFTIKIYNFYVITVLLFSLFFVQLQFNILGSNFAFVMFIFSFLLYYFFHILERRSFNKSYDVGNELKYLIYIIPVCVLVLAITFLFPVSQNRVAIPWLDKRIDATIENVINHFSGVNVSDFDYFSFGASGFGNSDKLGGNLKLNKTHVMNVKTDYSNLYLKATSKVKYDGHRWYDDDSRLISLGTSAEYNRIISNDALAVYTNILNQTSLTPDQLDKNDYYEISKAQVEFVNIKTKSLFLPIKIFHIDFKSPQEVFKDSEQMLSTKNSHDKGFTYNINYFSLMLNNDQLIELLRKSKTSVPRGMVGNVTITSSLKPVEVSSIVSADAAEIPVTEKDVSIEEIYRKYTQLPESITPRVRQLADELTRDKSNKYDKAKAVETYLADNYPYSLTPGNPPRRKDFVDYFLFEGKKGYCTYYASAMTVLLRCVDIPARYVEGYILPPESKDGVFKVTNQQAHAWVEVYFDDFGWIPFEPTSPFVANLYNDRTISATISGDMMNSRYDDYMEMMDRYRNQNSAVSYNLGDIPAADNSVKKPVLVLIIISLVLGAIILVLGTLASINYFRFYNLHRKIKKVDPNGAVLMAYNYILKALKYQGISIAPGETPTQFGERVEKLLDVKGFSFNQTSFTKITKYYVKARYSPNPLTDLEKDQIRKFIFTLLELINEKTGKIRFAFARYFLGKL